MDTFKLPYKGLELWRQLEVTDAAYTKRFDSGSFKGTAVDAVYNLKRLTELLGPVGFAWGWTIVRDELRKFGEGQNEQWVHTLVLRAWFRQEDGSVREVEHIGQTIAARWVGKGTKYFMVDGDYAKKSITDALSRIMMSLGASADIWLGRFDGNKYVPPKAGDSYAEESPREDGLVDEAGGYLLSVTNADEQELRQIRDWLASSSDGRSASRWVKLGVQNLSLREQLATAMSERALELGISLKGAA